MMPRMLVCEHIETVDSTQKESLRRILQGADTDLSQEPMKPFALWTLQQTQGLASHGRRWQDSIGGGLALSIAWPESIERTALPALPARLSVLVLSVLERTYPTLHQRLGVKWPNDIISADAKLAGVLVSRHQAKGLVWLIAGIGVNLLWKEPPQLERPVTDLKTLGVMDPDPAMLVAEIFSELQRLWQGEILTHGWEQEFMKRDTLLGCTVDVVHPLTGKVLQRGENNGVSAAGDLLLQVGRETVPVKIGELSLRRISQ